ncbi:MAG: exopolysaccharide biosynthesis polyprenyl glycosylphosphotransferase [Candidatus Ratteibacteria bacterium]|jgi:exopolysaccharide biosynthesis polyprenyl glycosylphosphotransferase
MQKRKIDLKYLIDAAIIFGSFLFSYYLRFFSGLFPDRVAPPLSVYVRMAGLFAVGWVIILKAFGLYRRDDFPEFLIVNLRLIQGTFWATVLLLSGTFFYRGMEFSRLVVGLALSFSFIFLYLFRLVFLRSGFFTGKPAGLLILANPTTGEHLKERLDRHAIHCRILGFLDPSGGEILAGLEKYLGSGELTGIICAERIPAQIVSDLLNRAKEKGVKVFFLPENYEISRSTASFDSLAGLPLLTFPETALEKFGNRLVKRTLDIFLSAILIIIFSPVFLVISLLVKLTSPGPVFFRQERTGYAGKTFRIIKFRTMYPTDGGAAWTDKDDSRLTRVGGVLRHLNLDELPQFFDVLAGRMSLVGPRPIALADVPYFQVSDFERRLKVKPGLTGWAQIHGLRGGHLMPEERLAYDLFYIENWSIWLDVVILLATPLAFRNAY